MLNKTEFTHLTLLYIFTSTHTHILEVTGRRKPLHTRLAYNPFPVLKQRTDLERLTAKDGRGQVLHTGDSGGQAGYDANDPIEKRGVGGHCQNGGLAAVNLLALDHHSEAHAEVIRLPQGNHHRLTQRPGDEHSITFPFVVTVSDMEISV